MSEAQISQSWYIPPIFDFSGGIEDRLLTAQSVPDAGNSADFWRSAEWYVEII
jgi:hypothetical protein